MAESSRIIHLVITAGFEIYCQACSALFSKEE